MNDEIKIPTMKVTPLKKICMTIGELPTSYLETMTYYEMLIWFINYLRDSIIPAVNNNAEAVRELQGLFVELQTYVNDYFDNLDVQEEINNKLDQMLEDGVLEQIIEQYIQSSTLWCFDSVNDMKEATNLIEGSYAKTLGYYEPNDGGSGIYRITDEELEVYQEELSTGLYATLININSVYVEQFGAKGDGTTDDSNAFTTATKYSKLNLSENKTYVLNQLIEIENDIIINGNNATIKGNGLRTTENLTIKNLNFKDINTNAIEINGVKKLIVNNCKFENIGISETLVPNYQGMAIYSISTDVDISNSYFKNCNGHGCIFATPPCYLIINNNIFEDNFYRAISVYSGNNENQATGKIYNNKINNSFFKIFLLI